jgi:hypothetical protein
VAYGVLPDTLSKDVLEDFPAVKAYHHSMASLEAVAAFYSKESNTVHRAGFMPDAA